MSHQKKHDEIISILNIVAVIKRASQKNLKWLEVSTKSHQKNMTKSFLF